MNGGSQLTTNTLMPLQTNYFGLISEVQANDPDTWRERVFLTFDLDWACDDVFNDTIDLLECAQVPATFFITHDTNCLERLRENPAFEIGIHPNFNSLIGATPIHKDSDSVSRILDNLLMLVPEAKAVRCHSLTQSSRLYDLFVDRGLTHECNTYIPSSAGITLYPWNTWQGLTKVPHFWEDDLNAYDGSVDVQRLVHDTSGLKVLDFHPIHVFLNSYSTSIYQVSRVFHSDVSELIKWRSSDTLGSRSQLLRLISVFHRF
jgi:hypothetical protein